MQRLRRIPSPVHGLGRYYLANQQSDAHPVQLNADVRNTRL